MMNLMNENVSILKCLKQFLPKFNHYFLVKVLFLTHRTRDFNIFRHFRYGSIEEAARSVYS